MRKTALLLGRQGSGKGTIGRIVQHGELHFLSAGEILRIESRAEAEREMRTVLSEGGGVATERSYPLIGEAIDRLPAGGLLLDGCPRQSDEVELVRELLGAEPALVVELYLPLPIAIERMLARSVCSSCEAPYGPKVPPIDGRCQICGGEVSRRLDDTPEGIRPRLETWDVEGRRIMRYYESKTSVIRVDAAREVTVVADEVARRVKAALGSAADEPREGASGSEAD